MTQPNFLVYKICILIVFNLIDEYKKTAFIPSRGILSQPMLEILNFKLTFQKAIEINND